MRPRNEEEEDDQNLIPAQLEIEDNSKHYGDYQGIVQNGSVRMIFANIHGIPSTADHPKKHND